MTVWVKIDGLTRKEDVLCAVEAGADALGFVVGFDYSPRNLTLERAMELLKTTPEDTLSVLVFNAQSKDYAFKVIARLKPKALQLYGDHVSRGEIRNTRIIRVVHAEPEKALSEALIVSRRCDMLLIDSPGKGRAGGTGVTHDWTLSRSVRDAVSPTPMILAGGLTPANVKRAIEMVKPFGVDVASGVESSPGIKDSSKVKDFIAKAKELRF